MKFNNQLKTLGWSDDLIETFSKVAEKVSEGAIHAPFKDGT